MGLFGGSNTNEAIEQLKKFEDVLNFKRNKLEPLPETSDINRAVNRVIELYIQRNQENMKVTGEAVLLADKIAGGDFGCRIGSKATDPTMTTLATTINNMLDNLQGHVDNAINILGEYKNHSYSARTNTDGVAGKVKEMFMKEF